MIIDKLRNDDSAVSPVIGVILMVAITVILAAVIATFVLGLGDQMGTSTPTATFDAEYEDGTGLVVTMENGQTLDASKLTFRADSLGDHTAGTYDETSENWAAADGSIDEISAGDSISVNVNSGDEVRLIYTDGETSTTLQTFDA